VRREDAPPRVRFAVDATVIVPVVFAPVALAVMFWVEPRAVPLVVPATLKPAPLAMVMFGELAMLPEPVRMRVRELMVVLPE